MGVEVYQFEERLVHAAVPSVNSPASLAPLGVLLAGTAGVQEEVHLHKDAEEERTDSLAAGEAEMRVVLVAGTAVGKMRVKRPGGKLSQRAWLSQGQHQIVAARATPAKHKVS